MGQDSDTSALFARAKEGDDRAIEEIVERHRGALTRYARAFSRVESDAEDIVQEAMIRATVSFGSLREEGALTGWLYKLTRNAGIDWYRRRRNREFPEEFDDDEVITQTGRELQPEALNSRRNDVALLYEAIQEFPPHFRIPLILCELDELSYEQVAEIERVPVGTIRSRLSRARKLLAELLNDVQRLHQEYEKDQQESDG